MEKQKMINNRTMNKRSQVTIFIIIAILIVAAIAGFFLFKGTLVQPKISKNLEPAYNYYISCIKNEVSNGAVLLGESGGYIEGPEFAPGSDYMPFSSYLGFLGNGIPYWYYISGNNVKKEQVPTKDKMQQQLNEYVAQGLKDCDFSSFDEKGYEISFSDAVVSTEIKETSISADVEQDIIIRFGKESWNAKKHSASVNSNLGKMFELAKKIYSNWKDTMFLENYGIDVLRLYAPVDGSEITCAPKIWSLNGIRQNVTKALEANVGAIKIKGDYYNLQNSENKYFVRDIGGKSEFNVNFMFSGNWPMKLEAWPSEDGLLRADPVGLGEGLGALGFCYVPYHFVYDLDYPVLIQIYSNDLIFQFPVVVAIDKNKARDSGGATGNLDVIPELCDKKITDMNVLTYNTNLEPVESDIKFKCFDTVCSIGKTSNVNGEAVLNSKFPQCGNGYIIASAEGYETKKFLVSTINPGNAEIVLDRKYNLELSVDNQGSEIEYAIINFVKGNKTTTVSYPSQKNLELTEGQYKIKVYVYSNSSISLQGSVTQKCVDIPKSGVFGMFGATDQKCFDLSIPSQTVDIGVSGGGTQDYYIAESELQSAKKIKISTTGFGSPKNLQELQNNYNSIETSKLDIYFE